MKLKFFIATLLILVSTFVQAENRPILKENFTKAKVGDFIVTSQNKMFSILHVKDKSSDSLVLEEITAPGNKIPRNKYTWREWVENDAPGNTSWVIYHLNTDTGNIDGSYSYTKNTWFKLREDDNFLSKLLSMEFYHVPHSERKRVGPRGASPAMRQSRQIWQPRMIVNGQVIPNVNFEAWKARWPKDGSELAGKLIEVYLPEESDRYPSYFPYWLQISGMIGKAKIRIIESGGDLVSPKPLM
ncbi:MAG: hypothetical protein VX777_02055 [Chlamydiota bacterium]|nr:hypothetical protein [Chlamydiota bacterium]